MSWRSSLEITASRLLTEQSGERLKIHYSTIGKLISGTAIPRAAFSRSHNSYEEPQYAPIQPSIDSNTLLRPFHELSMVSPEFHGEKGATAGRALQQRGWRGPATLLWQAGIPR